MHAYMHLTGLCSEGRKVVQVCTYMHRQRDRHANMHEGRHADSLRRTHQSNSRRL